MSTVIFDSEIAKLVGVNAAIIYERIRYFCEDAKNKNDHYKFHEGRFWTYSSSEGWSDMLPFLSAKQANAAISLLIEKKLISASNFNKNKYDRTRWFTILVETTTSICPVGKIDIPEKVKWKILNDPMINPKKENENSLEVRPIPNESSNESSNESNIYIAQSLSGDVSKFDFESLYKKYPRKEGKSRGLKICKTQIKTREDYEKLSQAIDNYTSHTRTRVKDSTFIKHFSTFMGEWRDWVNYEQSFDEHLTQEQLDERYGVKK